MSKKRLVDKKKSTTLENNNDLFPPMCTSAELHSEDVAPNPGAYIAPDTSAEQSKKDDSKRIMNSIMTVGNCRTPLAHRNLPTRKHDFE